jgi:hypothetical protein
MKTEGSFCCNKSPPLVLVTSQIKTGLTHSIHVSIKSILILFCSVCVGIFLLTLPIKILCNCIISLLISTCSANLIMLIILLLMMILKILASLSYGILTYTSRWVAFLLFCQEGPVCPLTGYPDRGLRYFSQSLQTSCVTCWITSQQFPSTSSPLHFALITVTFSTKYSEVLAAPVDKRHRSCWRQHGDWPVSDVHDYVGSLKISRTSESRTSQTYFNYKTPTWRQKLKNCQ